MSSRYRIRNSIWIFALALVCAASSYGEERFSDPTRPPTAIHPATKAQTKKTAGRPYELQAILHATGRRVAIINGKRVHENETIDGAKIVEILKGRVRMIREGKKINLSLSHERIRKTKSSKARNPSHDGVDSANKATEGRSK